MRIVKLSLVAIATMSICELSAASTLHEALSNGKVSGDVTITYENRDQDKEINNYYSNTSYSVGSTELIYKTAEFNNFSAVLGFRGYRVLFEDDKDSVSGYGADQGTGDASERFFGINSGSTAVATNAYIAYNTDMVHVKVGRQELETEWLDEHHDAVSIYVNPSDKAEVELIWSNRHNRLWSRELFHGGTISGVMGKINNEGDGIYKAGFTYKVVDSLKAKAYVLVAPDYYSIYGGKVNFDTKVNDISVGGFAHYMQTAEEDATGLEDGELLDLKAYVGFAGFTTALGYIQTGEDSGWGSAVKGGENVDPFEEGDQLYVKDSSTIYLSLSKSIAGVSLSGIYGVTEYSDFEKSEFCVWAGYGVTDALSLGAILTLTNEDEADPATTDMTQISTTLVYKF